MPIIEYNPDQSINNTNSGISSPDITYRPTFGETFKNTKETSWLYEAADSIVLGTKEFTPDDNYDVFDDLSGYEQYSDKFVGVESREESMAIKRRIDADIEAEDILSYATLPQQLAAGMMTDPTILIPGGVAVRGASIGAGALKTAAKTAAIGGATVAGTEAILQGTQEIRTAEDSAYAIGGATVLSGLLGGVAGGFASRSHFQDLAKRVGSDLDAIRSGAPLTVPDGTVGAMSALPKTTMEQETLKSAFGVEKALKFNDPVLRTAQSPSIVTRQLAEKLVEQPLIKNKNTEGIASAISVENRKKGWDVNKANFLKDFDSMFLQYRQNRVKNQAIGMVAERTKDLAGKFRQDGKLTYKEFGEEVVKAARNGDAHDIPEVAAAASALRKQIFDPLLQDAQKLGLFGEDTPQVDTALSYVNRKWSRSKILADLPKFEEINKKWLMQKRDEAAAELAHLKSSVRDMTEELKSRVATLELKSRVDDAEITQTAKQIVNRLTAKKWTDRLPYDFELDGTSYKPAGGGQDATLRGPLKSRAYDIPDNMVEDFLVNDPFELMESYTRTLSSDVELQRTFGTLDINIPLKQIEEDYAKLAITKENEIAQKFERGTPEFNKKNAKAQLDLKKQYESDIQDFSAMWERIRGTYAVPDDFADFPHTAERVLLNINYQRLLGGMTLSAITDVARPVFRHGLVSTYQDGLKPLVTNFRAFLAAGEQVKETGVALDMVLNSRAKGLGSMDEIIPVAGRIENGLNVLSSKFGVISLMSPWNSALKQFSGIITQSNFLKSAVKLSKGGKISAKEIENLSANFMDESMAKRVAAQFEKFGKNEQGLFIPNAQLWEDAEAQYVFRAAIRREVDKIIVTPGQDKPLWMSRSGFRLLGQFKSFAFASVQRTLLAGLQQRDAAALNGLIMSVALGMGVSAIHTKLSGREMPDEWQEWVSEGIDRSGMLAWLMDANNIAEKTSQGTIGMRPFIGANNNTRYSSRSALEALSGPSYGTVGDMVETVGSAFSGDWATSDTHKVRRLLPYQNLFYARWLFDKAEESVNSAAGIR